MFASLSLSGVVQENSVGTLNGEGKVEGGIDGDGGRRVGRNQDVVTREKRMVALATRATVLDENRLVVDQVTMQEGVANDTINFKGSTPVEQVSVFRVFVEISDGQSGDRMIRGSRAHRDRGKNGRVG